MADALLSVKNLCRRFGGIVATDDLSLDVVRGELHAIIGPNGAGKTTLISQLTGQLLPNSGTIHFAGQDVTHLPAYRRSALGLARSFQITSLLKDFTAIDNVALATQAHDGHSFRFWGKARAEPHLRKAAMDHQQPFRQRHALARLHRAAADEDQPVALDVDHAPAGAAQARVDAQNANRCRCHGLCYRNRLAASAWEDLLRRGHLISSWPALCRA